MYSHSGLVGLVLLPVCYDRRRERTVIDATQLRKTMGLPPAAMRLLYRLLIGSAAAYVVIVLYLFATFEIEENNELIHRLQHKGEDFYAKFRQSAARGGGSENAETSDAITADALPACPLPPRNKGRIPRGMPEPYLLRTGEAKYLPSLKPKDESCLRWKSASDVCWAHFSSDAQLCRLDGMALDADKFHVSKGGERPEDVKGRLEESEIFEAEECAVYLPSNPRFHSRWYQSKLIENGGVGIPERDQCDVHLPGLTLLYERIEYANLYHTMTDWFNVHWSLEKLKFAGDQELRFIWLDGHAKCTLDEVWADIFHANVTYVKQYEGIVCMERAIWIPKSSPVYDREKEYAEEFPLDGRKCDIMDRFIERVLTTYDIPLDRKIDNDLNLIIDRQPYFAHPRVNMEEALMKDSRNLPFLQEAFPKSRVIRLHEMSFRDQVKLISRAMSLKGVHGAGLTHLLWLPEGAQVVEWQPKDDERFDGNLLFEVLSTWVPGISHKFEPMPKKPKTFFENIVNSLLRRTDTATDDETNLNLNTNYS